MSEQHNPIKSPTCYSVKLTDEEIRALKASNVNGPLYHLVKQILDQCTITKEVRVNASSETESCPNCGGWGGGEWNGNDSPFQSYLPCYKCGL